MEKVTYQNWIVDIACSNGYSSDTTDSETVREIISEVRRALDRLSPVEREFIERYYFKGESYPEIAENLGRRRDRIKGLHIRAVGRLKKELAGFVRSQFNIKSRPTADCPICNSPDRDEIDALVDGKKEEETWREIIQILKSKYNIIIKTPQILIGHQKYH